jgi:hypothetical protein
MLTRIKPVFLFFAIAAVFIYSLSPRAQETKSQPELVTSDTPRSTPGGATFTVPTGWSISQGKGMVVLTPPETDTHIAIVDTQAADAKAAVEAAWTAYKSDFKRPLKLVTPVYRRVMAGTSGRFLTTRPLPTSAL